jgi:serine/threonine protein kinase
MSLSGPSRANNSGTIEPDAGPYTAPAAMAPRRRPKLIQPLTLGQRIGRGRLGAVYAGVHPILARRFAVKVFRPELTLVESTRTRLRQTVREVSQLEHPAICSLYDFGQLPGGRHYITMDYVRGTQLAEMLEREGPLDWRRAVPLLVQLANALAAAHRQRIVHADLKPTNLMLADTNNEPETLRLLDFRLSLALSAEASDEADHLAAYGDRLEYLAPEQIAGVDWDARVDIYAFGCLAYCMLTGRPPFIGDRQAVTRAHEREEPTPLSERADVDAPSRLAEVVSRCLEKRPRDRFRSAAELEEQLSPLVEALEPPEAPLAGVPELRERHPELTRLERQLYRSIRALARHVVQQGGPTHRLETELGVLGLLREHADLLAKQVELVKQLSESSHEEFQRCESSLRHAIIELTLAVRDAMQQDMPAERVADLESQLVALEESLAREERKWRARRATLETLLEQARERRELLERQQAACYRRLYGELARRREAIDTPASDQLYEQLEGDRAALAELHPLALEGWDELSR